MAHSDGLLAYCLNDDAPAEARVRYWNIVNAAWGVAAAICAISTVGLAYIAHRLGLPPIQNAIVAIGQAAAFLCLGGCVSVLWRRRYATQARRRATHLGVLDQHYHDLMARSLPRNSSLVFQGAAGLIAAAITTGALA